MPIMANILQLLGLGSVLSIPCNMPLQPVGSLRFGCETERELALRICCHNTRYAETPGFFTDPHIDLFSKISPEGVTTFYDSTCGVPLFIAPQGRTLEEWKQESLQHGWPSFRPQEAVAANIVFHEGGEMASVCGTHLGHNLPDFSGDRYCIDLVCIAGQAENGTVAIQQAALRQQATLFMQKISRTSSRQNGNTQPLHLAEIAAAAFLVAVLGLVWARRRLSLKLEADIAPGPQADHKSTVYRK
jgi:peptide methionine sulfoxide reductase MsrB